MEINSPGDDFIFEIWHRMNESYVPKSEFMTYEVPAGTDMDELWRGLTRLRRHSALMMPFRPLLKHGGDDISWIALPRDCQVSLLWIAANSSSITQTAQYIEAKPPCIRITLMLDEIIAACMKDGLDIDAKTIKEMVWDTRRASTVSERIVESFCMLLNHLGSFEDRRIDKDMINELCQKIAPSRCNETAFKSTRRYPVAPEGFRSEAMDCLCQLLNDDTFSQYGDPVVSWIGATTMFWDCEPLPYLNALTELLVRQIFFRQHNRALLGYIDFLAESLKWEHGRETRSKELPVFRDVTVDDSNEGFDATYYFTCALIIIREGINHLDESVEHLASIEKSLAGIIESDNRLNLRQKQFILGLGVDIGARITIKQYEDIYNVVHSTALADLQLLLRTGYVHMTYEGHHQVYSLDVTSVMKAIKTTV